MHEHYGECEFLVEDPTVREARYGIDMSITRHELWPRLKEYLFVIRYDKDGGHEDPRIRIELRGLPLLLSAEAQIVTMPCVSCERPIMPLRRREGDGHDRLYYAVACQVGVRIECSRSSAASDEYERFKTMAPERASPQLALF